MKMTVQWFDNDRNLKPIYSNRHFLTLEADTAAAIMKQYRIYRDNHDCVKFTPTEIVNIED